MYVVFVVFVCLCVSVFVCSCVCVFVCVSLTLIHSIHVFFVYFLSLFVCVCLCVFASIYRAFLCMYVYTHVYACV